MQIVVLGIFLTIAAISIFGFSKLELGLEISELAPVTSYMRRFDEAYAEYFNKFDQPTDIFFLPTPAVPAASQQQQQKQQQQQLLQQRQGRTQDTDLFNPTEFLGRPLSSETTEETSQQLQAPQWWKPEVQAALRLAHHRIASRPSTSRLVNPLLAMLDDPEIGPKLRQGDKQASCSSFFSCMNIFTATATCPKSFNISSSPIRLPPEILNPQGTAQQSVRRLTASITCPALLIPP